MTNNISEFNKFMTNLYGGKTDAERINAVRNIILFDNLGLELIKRLAQDVSERQEVRLEAVVQLLHNKKVNFEWIKNLLNNENESIFFFEACIKLFAEMELCPEIIDCMLYQQIPKFKGRSLYILKEIIEKDIKQNYLSIKPYKNKVEQEKVKYLKIIEEYKKEQEILENLKEQINIQENKISKIKEEMLSKKNLVATYQEQLQNKKISIDKNTEAIKEKLTIIESIIAQSDIEETKERDDLTSTNNIHNLKDKTKTDNNLDKKDKFELDWAIRDYNSWK